MTDLKKWEDIKGDYSDCLILGNGASICFDPEFSYRSLLQVATEQELLSPNSAEIFRRLGTSDFEQVLHSLNTAIIVANVLDQDCTALALHYKEIKDSLIKTVTHIHPEHQDTLDKLDSAGSYLSQFRTIFSLNYDLIPYWILMRYNEKLDESHFRDCFGPGGYTSGIAYHKSPTNSIVLYPHGNMVIAVGPDLHERKIAASGTRDLLRKIGEKWQEENMIPLFVSEGTTENKLTQILQSKYLRSVYEELSSPRNSVCIYGWQIGSQDQHIMDALGKTGIKKIAMSVYGDDHKGIFRRKMENMVRKTTGLDDTEIVFFKSDDSGVWIHP